MDHDEQEVEQQLEAMRDSLDSMTRGFDKMDGRLCN